MAARAQHHEVVHVFVAKMGIAHVVKVQILIVDKRRQPARELTALAPVDYLQVFAPEGLPVLAG